MLMLPLMPCNASTWPSFHALLEFQSYFFFLVTVAPEKEFLGFQKWHLLFFFRLSFCQLSQDEFQGKVLSYCSHSPMSCHYSKVIVFIHHCPTEVNSQGKEDFHFVYSFNICIYLMQQPNFLYFHRIYFDYIDTGLSPYSCTSY